MDDFIAAWATAIQQFEGFNTPGSTASRNHNPGNLKYAGQPGAVGQDPRGFAVFSDDQAGLQALYNQLAKYVRTFPGYTILQITSHYLGQSVPTVDAEGNAFNYANYVAGQLGVSVSATLGDLAAGLFGGSVSSDGVEPSGSPSDSGSSGAGNALMWIAGAVLFLVLYRSIG